MPLPAGFVLEEEQQAPQITPKVNVPAGFELESKEPELEPGIPREFSGEEIRAAPDSFLENAKHFFYKPFEAMTQFFRDPDKDIAKAQNIYALADVTGLPLKEVNENYEVLKRSVKVTGITPDINRKEYMQMIMLPLVAYGAATNPLGTAAGLVTFGALNKAIPTDKFIEHLEKKGVSDDVIATVELADFIGKAFIAGKVFEKAPQVAEIFLKQKLIEYKMPTKFTMKAEQVRDIFQTGKLTTAEEKAVFSELGLKGKNLRTAIKEGITIDIPTEKLVRITDRPYWAKIKEALRIKSAEGELSKELGWERWKSSQEEVQVSLPKKPKQAPAGLIEGKVASAKSIAGEATMQAKLAPVPKEGGGQPIAEGIGETKVRGLAKGIEEKAIENKLTKSFGDLPEYQTVNMKDQASKVQDLIEKDFEMAKRVAMGEELPPEGLLPESVLVGVENKAIAENDVGLLKDLATSSGLMEEATFMGQRIRTLRERNPESPAVAIGELAKVREEVAKRKLKTKDIKKLHKKEIKSIKEEIRKVAPTKETWADFVKSIQC